MLEGLDASKISYEVSKSRGEEILKIFGILEDSLGIPWDSLGFLGTPEDSWGFQRILEDSGENRLWGFSGF